MNVIERLEFEYDNYDVAVWYFKHYATKPPTTTICIRVYSPYIFSMRNVFSGYVLL